MPFNATQLGRFGLAAADLSGAESQHAVLVADVAREGGGFATANAHSLASGSHTEFTAATFRIPQTATLGVRAVRLVFVAGRYSGGAETTIAAPIEVKASIEVGGVSVPVFFAGKRLALVRPGAVVLSDWVFLQIDVGTTYYLRIFNNRLASSAYADGGGETGLLSADQASAPANYLSAGASDVRNDGGGFTRITGTGVDPFAGGDRCDNTGAMAANSMASCFIPFVVGWLAPSEARTLAICGTSIEQGAGEAVANATVGWAARGAVASGWGYTNLAIPSSIYASHWVPPSAMARRGVGLRSAAYVVLGGVTNDLSAGRSLAQIQGDIATLAARFAARGQRVILSTTIPRTTSTDGWLTTGNQTVLATEAVRLAYNAWVRAGGIADVDAICDPAALVEDGGASAPTGKFIAGAVLASGTPTGVTSALITDTGAAWVPNGFAGKTLRNVVTGGTACIGYNTATQIFYQSLSGAAWTAGEGYEVLQVPTYDGTHPNGYGHGLMSAAISTALDALEP